ncbi:MAG: hypothetical protein EOP47_18415 [Sphingobacteriaceae bacterium]|nr:MAG: hypothetical protein EOP47_18415 [Sphingobacteriaceae bacterium]
MRTLNLALIFILAACLCVKAQTTEDFTIKLTDSTVIKNSLYDHINVLDVRLNPTNYGTVQVGAFNRRTKVMPVKPLETQFRDILASVIDSNAQKGELLLQVRKFGFGELTSGFSENGYGYFRLGLYARNGDNYQKLKTIDTVINVSSVDVTHKLFRVTSEYLTHFITSNLTRHPSGSLYNYNDLVKIDSIEKQQIPLYTAEKYTDGIYVSYKSFFNQTPDKQGEVKVTTETIKSVKIPDAKGKLNTVSAKELYAVVFEGRLYIATNYGFYPLIKQNNDFKYTGRGRSTIGNSIATSAMFGLAGALISANPSGIYELKLDYVNGDFIRLRRLK